MADRAKLRRQKARLYRRQNGKCHWCGEPMLAPETKVEPKRKVSVRLCTIDHLDDRFNRKRGTYTKVWRQVAACWECNTRRGAESQKSVPIEILRQRAKLHGLNEAERAAALRNLKP